MVSKLAHQRTILIFGIGNDDVILGQKKYIDNFTLGTKGFTTAGCTQKQTVRVFQVLPVSHNQVVGKGVETVIQSLALLEQFTGRKRYEDCRAAGGKPALNLNLVLTQGK